MLFFLALTKRYEKNKSKTLLHNFFKCCNQKYEQKPHCTKCMLNFYSNPSSPTNYTLPHFALIFTEGLLFIWYLLQYLSKFYCKKLFFLENRMLFECEWKKKVLKENRAAGRNGGMVPNKLIMRDVWCGSINS